MMISFKPYKSVFAKAKEMAKEKAYIPASLQDLIIEKRLKLQKT